MRTLISTAFVSLDGVMEAPGGEPGYRNSGWTFKNVEFLPEAYALKGQEQEEATALLLGRASYEAFSPVWPGMAEFAEYKVMPKYVVS
ncbi:dihydrofolate reductase family protein, partial [Streptomyces sp. SID7499]|nr:dihydrofolate reductase family protein [Streptomyces sp. SID7499]